MTNEAPQRILLVGGVTLTQNLRNLQDSVSERLFKLWDAGVITIKGVPKAIKAVTNTGNSTLNDWNAQVFWNEYDYERHLGRERLLESIHFA